MYIEDKIFEKIDFTEALLNAEEYEACRFENCIFANMNLSKIRFSGCSFNGCNLSMASLAGTALQNVKFSNCKLLGLRFDECSEFLFEVAFDHCILDLSSFYKRKMKKTKFTNSSLKEVDFVETDLGGAVFDECDLAGAAFNNTNLEKANFISSFNYSFDPEANKMKKAKFSATGVLGLLDKYGIEIV